MFRIGIHAAAHNVQWLAFQSTSSWTGLSLHRQIGGLNINLNVRSVVRITAVDMSRLALTISIHTIFQPEVRSDQPFVGGLGLNRCHGGHELWVTQSIGVHGQTGLSFATENVHLVLIQTLVGTKLQLLLAVLKVHVVYGMSHVFAPIAHLFWVDNGKVAIRIGVQLQLFGLNYRYLVLFERRSSTLGDKMGQLVNIVTDILAILYLREAEFGTEGFGAGGCSQRK